MRTHWIPLGGSAPGEPIGPWGPSGIHSDHGASYLRHSVCSSGKK